MGWAQTFVWHSAGFSNGKVNLLPCVYASQSDRDTWKAVADAAAAGTGCYGEWIARWRSHGCVLPPEWDDGLVNPDVGIPCRVLLWQYADDCNGGGGFDCDECNPSLDLRKDLLDRLILPPRNEGV
jgi:hypothetical protein